MEFSQKIGFHIISLNLNIYSHLVKELILD